MTRLLAWANVNQLFMVLSKTGDERHAREGKVRIVIYHKPDREAYSTATIKQMKNSSLSNCCERPYGWMQSISQDVNRYWQNTSGIGRNADRAVRGTVLHLHWIERILNEIGIGVSSYGTTMMKRFAPKVTL